MAAAFNAPLAGFIFVLEELRRGLSPVTYGTALIAAVAADFVTRMFYGQMPSFRVHGYPTPALSAIPVVAVVGLVAGFGGVAFNRSLLWSLDWFGLRRMPPWARVATVGAFADLVAWCLPEAVGGGHRVAERILRGEFADLAMMRFVLVLVAAKFVLTVLSYGSGAPGGIFAPMLVIGALMDLLVGQTTSLIFPAVAGTPAAFAVLGMAAYFSAVVRAPLTGIVLIVEMTGNYEQMFALAVACLVAYAVAKRLGDRPIYEALLLRDVRTAGPVIQPESGEPMLVTKVVEAGSRLDGCQLRDARLPTGCLFVTLRRGGQERVPGGQTRLQAGDEIVAAISGDTGCALAALDEAVRCQPSRAG